MAENGIFLLAVDQGGVLQWKKSQINNGLLEGLNSLIQAAKAKAGGFSTFRNFRIVAFLS